MNSLVGHTVVYGGSFNPPHMAHQMACLYLLEGLGAHAVWLVPAHVHPFGKRLADFEHRLAMCRLLAAPFAERVVVSDVERALGGAGRTYDTLVHLIAAHPQGRFALAVGADILGEAHSWYRWDDIERLVPLAVIGRAGYRGRGRAVLDLPRVSSSDIRRRVARGESLDGLVPCSVAEYVAAHGLYRSRRSRPRPLVR